MTHKAILEIITNEKGATKKKRIKYSTRDPEVVQVNYSINKMPSQLLGEIPYSPEDFPPPPPPDNQAPIVEAGENVTVKEGATVTLDGSAHDDGAITSAEWILPDGITPTDINEENLLVEFTAPTIPQDRTVLLLNCTLVVEDDRGLRSSDQCIITVVRDITIPPPPPPPPVPDTLLYDSNTIGKWIGNDRVVTDYDELFPKPFVDGKGFSLNASGSNAKATIENGVLTLTANAGHKRIYIDSSNYNTYTIYELRFNDSIVRNHTMQKQSRHNHGGDIENKFGGLNHLTDLEEQKCGLKIELWHTGPKPNHVEGGKEPLPFKISVGDWVFVKCTDQIFITEKKEIKDGKEVTVIIREILSKTEYSKDGNSWVLGIEKTYDLSDSKYDFIFNQALYLESSATWYRINPKENGTKGISIRNVRDFQL